jgi:hypothetical protein
MFAPAYSGFPVEIAGVGELHAAFLNESRTRGCWWCPVREIRVHGLKRAMLAVLVSAPGKDRGGPAKCGLQWLKRSEQHG